MKKYIIVAFIFMFSGSLFAQKITALKLAASPLTKGKNIKAASFFPANKAKDVNPDTHLVLSFRSQPTLGKTGKIRIYDAANNRLVDVLDMSIPAGPTISTKTEAPYTQVPYSYAPSRATNADTKPGTPSGTAIVTPNIYQLTIIGGFTDAFHFYPVIILGNTATIYPHNNLLEYNKTYYVQIDPSVFTLKKGSFAGIKGKTGWIFSTKKSPPPKNSARIVVSADGKGDFSTVQGAIDFIPDLNPQHVTVYIKKGTYEEIVYFRNKTNITFLGEDRNKTVVCYANNEVFNPHPANIATNEVLGTFPSRRAAFMGDNSKDIRIVNMTIKNLAKGQAEGLLLMGEENIVSNSNIEGSGDALQINGSTYLNNCKIKGDGDIVLGRGPAFFNNCGLVSTGGCFMWVRNTSSHHGFIFLNCKFQNLKGETEIARAPTNHGKNYPNCEAVLLNCALTGISPTGWGPVGGDVRNVHYWEFNSRDLKTGKPVDTSKRRPLSRQLTKEKDSEIIQTYSEPSYILNGWKPTL